MKKGKFSIAVRIMCMILCMCMVTTTLASCDALDLIVEIVKECVSLGGANNEKPPVENPPIENPPVENPPVDNPGGDNPGGDNPGGDNPGGDNPGGDNPGGNNPGGDTETTYYKVSFAVAIEEYASRVTLPEEKLYKKGTEIQYLPTPAVQDLLFMGWYYDAAMTREVQLTDKVNSDIMLYAKVVDTSDDITAIEGVYYHTVYDVDDSFVFAIKADSLADVSAALSIVCISSAGEALVEGEDYDIISNGDGTFKVRANYKAGKTYKATVDSEKEIRFVVDGAELSSQVTTLNILVAKEDVSNLTLADGMIYIPLADVEMLTDVDNGLFSVSLNGASANTDTGYFVYNGQKLKSGDKVAIYEGVKPSERDFNTDNGSVKYLTIIGVGEGNVYMFRVSDSREVLFIPDIIPVAGKTNRENEAKIHQDLLDFTNDFFKQLGMNEDTRIEVGDYIAFFDGPMSATTPIEYVRITEVYRSDAYFYIDYVPVTYDEVVASMDLYHTRTQTPELSDSQIEAIEQQVYNDAINSGFVEEAAEYLVNLYVSTNGLETMPNGTRVTYSPKMRSYSTRSSGVYYEITKCEAKPDIKMGEGVLKHFEESNGIRVELILSFEIEFTVGEDGENKVVISAEAVFEEEVLLTINVDGGAVWEMAWIFPYIADYEMNANIDIGTYTGVSVIAKVYTNNGEEKEDDEDGKDEEDDDSFFPDFDFDKLGDSELDFDEKTKVIGEELKKLFELNDKIKEEVEGEEEEEEDDTGNDITEKYAEMMKDANETWIELVREEIYKQSMNIDQLGVLWFDMSIDFVVSAQLYIIAGIEIETGVAKRYNFSVTLFERTVKTDVIDLEKAHFSFKFYCMGTAGIKVGFEIELSLALFSSDVASVGISAELGVALGIWGYFYYSYEKEAGEDPVTQKAGAMFFEIGIYIEVKFKAHLFNIEKITYNPTLYENLWPIYSVGTQENVFGFEDYEDHELIIVMQGVNYVEIPTYIFRMKYLDLKDGKYYAGKESDDETPSKSFDDETESRFIIEISDSRFTYDPATNTLTTTVDVENMDVGDTFEITITLTWKHGSLAFNQEIISREFTVKVTNDLNYKYVHVVHDGPSIYNASGPKNQETLVIPFRVDAPLTVDMLPKYDVVDGYKFVRWLWWDDYKTSDGKIYREGDEFTGLEDENPHWKSIRLIAEWEPLEVEASVRIFKESDGGAYIADGIRTITALAGQKFNLTSIVDDGYAIRKGDKYSVDVEQGSVFDLYLERETKGIRFYNIDGERGSITTYLKSGSSLVPPVVSRPGYDFAGWALGYLGTEAYELPEFVPYESNINDGSNIDFIYTALWTPAKNIEFTVKHYIKNPNDSGYTVYMSEYKTGTYNERVYSTDCVNQSIIDEGYIYESGGSEIIALDGSTVIRVYYGRETRELHYELDGGRLWRSSINVEHGKLVDTSTLDVPNKTGYKFVGWDADGDGIKDDTFVMPNGEFTIHALWEGVDGTEYKVIHMLKNADDDNYSQVGVSYMYGVTGSTPDAKSIYDAKYIVDGQYYANYDKAVVSAISANKVVTMYAYYERVEYNLNINAYDPENGSLIKTVTVNMPYGRTIKNSFLPKLDEFAIEGYNARGYSNSGYYEMPNHDVDITVQYVESGKTPYVVNHYIQNVDGTYTLYKSQTMNGKVGTVISKSYQSYSIKDALNKNDTVYYLNADLVEETAINRDGSTTLNLYYDRIQVKMTGNVYKLDKNGNVVDKIYISEYYKVGEFVSIGGYFPHYEFDRLVNHTTGITVTAKTGGFVMEYAGLSGAIQVDIYVKPQAGVPYTVNYYYENVEGTGYELVRSEHQTGVHDDVISSESFVKVLTGMTAPSSMYETITLDANGENVLNVYYNRNIYNIYFKTNIRTMYVSYKLRYGAPMPEAPDANDYRFEYAGYDIVGWGAYEYYRGGTVPAKDLTCYAEYKLSPNTPYKVNHYVMNFDGEYELKATENLTGTTYDKIYAADYVLSEYSVGFSLSENNSLEIAPDGSSVLNIYYDRASYTFGYHYYIGGKETGAAGEIVMYGDEISDAIYDYINAHPEYKLLDYSILKDGQYVAIEKLPEVMGSENIEIRVSLEAIGPEVTIIHKVMNTDGVTYTEEIQRFTAIPFEELDLADYLLAIAGKGFSYRIPVNNQIPDALKENVYEIYYDRETYTIKYTNGYNFEWVTKEYLFGATIGEAPVFDRDGYRHMGWNEELPTTMPASNLTLSAKWELLDPVAVTVIHMMQSLDGTGYVEKHRNTVYSTPELMIFGSYYAIDLSGGTYESAEKKVVAIDGSTEIRVYYTRNEYTVRFTYGNIQGAGEDVVYTLSYEEKLVAPNFQITGYNLVGWSPELHETMPAENITFTAKWQVANVSVTINHWTENLDGEGNALFTSEILNAETGASLNGADYAKEIVGFTYANADKNVIVAPDGTTVVNIYYTRNSYTLTFTYGEMMGEAIKHTVKYGDALPEAPQLVAVGYIFAGWDSGLVSTMPASNLTYSAQWTPDTNTKFTVEHYYQNANDDGYVMLESEIKHGTTNEIVDGTSYKKDIANAVYERAESKSVNADGSTVIKVYYTRSTYKLTFTYGDKTGESVEYILRYGQNVSYNPSFAVQGYVFDAWDNEIPATMPANDVVLNATWKAGDGVKYTVEHYLQNADDDDYTLDHVDNRTGVTGALINGADLATLVGNGIVLKSAESATINADGSTVIKIYYDRVSYKVTYSYGTMQGESVVHTVKYGATLPVSPEFEAIGYTFGGWDSALASTMPANDIVYVAQWTPNSDTEFTVEHYYQNANDNGYEMVDSEIMQGTTASFISGESFKKDLENAIFESAENGTIAPDGTTVIKIYYVRPEYTVTFKYGHVANDEEIFTVRYGATLPEAPKFTAPGYYSEGWMDEEGGWVDEFDESMPAHNLVYIAIWMERDDTQFTVEHYIEQANGNGYDFYSSETQCGRTNEWIDGSMYVIYFDESMYVFERFTEETYILPDGSAVVKIYYQRARHAVTFYVVNEVGNFVDGMDSITVEFKYGQNIIPPTVEVLDGYTFVGYDTSYEIMPEYEIEYYIIWNCIHDSVDGDHECDRCGEPLECADNNDDGHCDYGREPVDPDEHRYVDNDNDHICDICCGSFTDLCFDEDKNGECDICEIPTVCPVTGEDHRDDEENDHLCDDCGVWLSYMCVIDSEDSHECSICYARFYDMCTDKDHNCWCDICNSPVLCIDNDGDEFCDVCKNQMPCLGHIDEDKNAVCDYCRESLQWCDEFDDMHRDENGDHTCDNCGLWLSHFCSDWDDDGRCNECYRPAWCMQEVGKNHIDDDGDHFCDECGSWMSYTCVDEDGDWICDECFSELRCYDHIDEDRNAVCDICGEETKCKENPYNTSHENYGSNHTCDFCGVWISTWCIDHDYDGYCDEYGCSREFVCDHIDEDEDNCCDRCYRIINCIHEYTTEHYCDECYRKVTDCHDDDGDLWCDECWQEMECRHDGMDGEHVCYYCYAYLSDCADADGDGECDLSGYFPHSPQ